MLLRLKRSRSPATSASEPPDVSPLPIAAGPTARRVSARSCSCLSVARCDLNSFYSQARRRPLGAAEIHASKVQSSPHSRGAKGRDPLIS